MAPDGKEFIVPAYSMSALHTLRKKKLSLGLDLFKKINFLSIS